MDYLINKNWYYQQPEQGYHVNSDTIFLAGFIQARHKDRVLDIGCGAGALMILVDRLVQPRWLDGIDINTTVIDYAKKNIKANGLSDKTMIISGDITNYTDQLGYEVIISNPPYYPSTGIHIDPLAYQGRYQTDLSFDQLILAIKRLLKPKGCAYIVLPVHGFNHMMQMILSHKMSVSRLRLYYPSVKKDASIMALALRHGTNSHCIIEKPWHKDDFEQFCNELKNRG